MKATNTETLTFAWEVQYESRSLWRKEEGAVVTTTADPVSVARAALASVLMTVDHANDLDGRRAVIRLPLGSESIVVTERDLEYYLRKQDYYLDPCPALTTVLPKDVHDVLPAHLRAQLDRVGPPGE